MNNPVSFEIAKLLKEKGFNNPTQKYYEYALKSKKNKEDGYSGSFGWKKGELNLQSGYFQNNSKSDFTSEMWYMCSAPPITEAVMWLYKKHGIWIYPLPIDDDMKLWQARIIKGEPFSKLSNTLKIISHGEISYRGIYSPTEAYETAIEYTLKNLIK